MDYKVRKTKVTITPGELFSEHAYEVEIADEGGGEFLIVTDLSTGKAIRIDADVWPIVRGAVDDMAKEVV